MSQQQGTAAEIAAALRQIADRIVGLDLPEVHVRVDFQPHGGEAVEVAAIDAIGVALSGSPGKPREMSNGTYHHDVRADFGLVTAAAYTSVMAPEERQQMAELERLRARVAEVDPDWYIAQQGADVAIHRMDEVSS